MLIDWFTVTAQIINFIILIWLLKKFLYKPVLKMITDRQNEIAKHLNEAEVKKREAEEECQLFQSKIQEFEQQKTERIKKLNEEIKQLQDRLRAEARHDIDEQRAKWLSNLKNEQEGVFRDLNQRIQTELFSMMRKAMTDLADTDIHERLVAIFLQRLKTIAQRERGSACWYAHVRDQNCQRDDSKHAKQNQNSHSAGVQSRIRYPFCSLPRINRRDRTDCQWIQDLLEYCGLSLISAAPD